jgi:glycosyltransferase involved in cell wall biosynthesis
MAVAASGLKSHNTFMNHPTISVVIPTWNSAATLKATIESCLEQTLSSLEILVCDDGSTDHSYELVASIQDPRIKWIEGLHSGTPAVPRNRGLAAAQGEWVAFCDSDDQWLPGKLAKQMAALENNSCEISCTNALRKIDGIIAPQTISDWKKEFISFGDLLRGNIVVCSSVMMKRSLYTALGGFPDNIDYAGFEDYLYWLRVATKTDFAFVDEALVIYDDHPATSIRSINLSNAAIQTSVFDDFIKQSRPFIFKIQVRIRRLELAVKKTVKNSIKYLYRHE